MSDGSRTFGFAGFAAPWLILELFVVKEKLFPGGEDEIVPAVYTFKVSILEFHREMHPHLVIP